MENYYASLASNPTDANLAMLLDFAKWDERAVSVVIENQALLDKLIDGIADVSQSQDEPDVDSIRFLTAAAYYPQVQEVVKPCFIPIASKLQRYESWRVGSALADLMGSIAMPDSTHLELFNYSESYRHMILSRNLLAQRGTMKLLAFLFSDDFLQDAVSVLQYKSDILNHINRVFVDTPDFVSWRFSVRVMSLAGGYNEDRFDVESTDRLCRYVTRSVPEFFLYFSVAFLYGMIRFFPKRAKGKIPKWLRRRRAVFTGTVCGLLGVYSNSFCSTRLGKVRAQYDLLRNQEMRRRRGAKRQELEYQPNTYFDTSHYISNKIWHRQFRDYANISGFLLLSCAQIPKIKFPGFLGDVVFQWPFLPTLFPSSVGLPCTSRSLIPYLVIPFLGASAINRWVGGPMYDWYVHQRYAWWKQYRSSDVLEW